MSIAPIAFRCATLGIAMVILAACPGDPVQATPGARAEPRKDDPKLSQTWAMAKDTSPLASGDMGSNPDELAQALYDNGMPGITHRVSKACADSGKLANTTSVALRFAVGKPGTVSGISADPAGAAAQCIGDGFKLEAAALSGLPAGDALVRLKFHPAQ